jgi:hypothetical protein
MVGWPDCEWSLSLNTPKDDPTISVACQQTAVLANKQKAVNMGSMATENSDGLCWWESGGLAL